MIYYAFICLCTLLRNYKIDNIYIYIMVYNNVYTFIYQESLYMTDT